MRLDQVCWLSFALLVALLGSPTEFCSGKDLISNKGENNSDRSARKRIRHLPNLWRIFVWYICAMHNYCASFRFKAYFDGISIIAEVPYCIEVFDF